MRVDASKQRVVYGLFAVCGVLVIILVAVGFIWPDASKRSGGADAFLVASHQAFNAGDLDAAIAAAEGALAEDPQNADALLAKAAALAQKGSLTFKEEQYGMQAIALAQEALALAPDSVTGWRLVGYAHEIMQQYDAAHEAYAKALSIDPRDVAAISQDAHAYDLEGNSTRAAAGYRLALSIDPNFAQAHMGLGKTLLREGDIDGAEAMFRSVGGNAENARQRSEGLYSAGVIVNERGDFQEAERLMRVAADADPSYALAWVGLGTTLFNKSISADPSLTVSDRQALGEESMDYLFKALELNPGQTLAHMQIGLQLAALGMKDAAREKIREARRLVDTDITLGAREKQGVIDRLDTAVDVFSL